MRDFVGDWLLLNPPSPFRITKLNIISFYRLMKVHSKDAPPHLLRYFSYKTTNTRFKRQDLDSGRVDSNMLLLIHVFLKYPGGTSSFQQIPDSNQIVHCCVHTGTSTRQRFYRYVQHLCCNTRESTPCTCTCM